LEPKPAKFGIAVAVPLVGQSAEPAHQPVLISQFEIVGLKLAEQSFLRPQEMKQLTVISNQ
jgi:hypothetical protein